TGPATGGFAALADPSTPSPRATLSVGAAGAGSPAGPAAHAGAAPALAADALAPLPGGVPVQPAGPKALEALAEAKKYLGTPYLWGGSQPPDRLRCSAL